MEFRRESSKDAGESAPFQTKKIVVYPEEDGGNRLEPVGDDAGKPDPSLLIQLADGPA